MFLIINYYIVKSVSQSYERVTAGCHNLTEYTITQQFISLDATGKPNQFVAYLLQGLFLVRMLLSAIHVAQLLPTFFRSRQKGA